VNMSHELRNNWKPSASIDAIKVRARMLQSLRAFFAEQSVLEVETPVLSQAAITDPHLQSFSTEFLNQRYYLHTSPEFFMKRLLASGSGDIYQVCKVFRDDEQGKNHNPEFTMLEWYRLDFDHHQLMDEVENFLHQSLKALSSRIDGQSVTRISYQQAFLDTLGIDPLDTHINALKNITEQNNIAIPVGMSEQNKDMWLDWLMTQAIAPAFSKQGFTFLYDYPASQAALAKISETDSRVAHRFEVFFGELELANGFYELTDAVEQEQRFNDENKKRVELNMPEMPVDENLLAALDAGLPECSGVAIGLDRLLMVLLEKNDIGDVMGFSFDRT
jgi:elongation factor P--(R)-beta-lysine ligase